MIRIVGMMCRMIVVFVVLFIVMYVFDDVGLPPWFSAVYMNREYPTVRNLISPIGMMVIIDCLIILVINRISLMRLILGGAAILAPHARNHHMVASGSTAINPLVSAILRLCLDSYVMYAM